MTFILTSETGRRLYCASLNFHQPSTKMAYKQRQKQKEKERQLMEQLKKDGQDMTVEEEQLDPHGSLRRGKEYCCCYRRNNKERERLGRGRERERERERGESDWGRGRERE